MKPRSIDSDLLTLLEIMTAADRPREAAHARAALETIWAAGPPHRAEIWAAIDEHLCRYNLKRPLPVIRFLLDPDPESPYEPRTRLITGLSLPTRQSALSLERALMDIVGSQSLESLQVRQDLTNVLSCTDQPKLLALLESEFMASVECYSRYPSPKYSYPSHCLLWGKAGTTSTPLLTAVLANPNLPRRQAAAANSSYTGVASSQASVLLFALRNQDDMLGKLDDGRLVARTLLDYLGSWPPSSAKQSPLPEVCRRALRTLPPGPARDAICAFVLERDGLPFLGTAAAVAVDAGYRPSDQTVVPLFLAVTRQWNELATIDPLGERLYAYGVGSTFDAGSVAGMVRSLLYVVQDNSAPAVIREASRRTLRDQQPGPALEYLCQRALGGHDDALRAVVEGSLTPSGQGKAAVFLFLTEQWDRYDAADPEGNRLDSYARALAKCSSQRVRLRAAAERGGRPMPCEAPAYDEPPSSSRNNHYNHGPVGSFPTSFSC